MFYWVLMHLRSGSKTLGVRANRDLVSNKHARDNKKGTCTPGSLPWKILKILYMFIQCFYLVTACDYHHSKLLFGFSHEQAAASTSASTKPVRFVNRSTTTGVEGPRTKPQHPTAAKLFWAVTPAVHYSIYMLSLLRHRSAPSPIQKRI